MSITTTSSHNYFHDNYHRTTMGKESGNGGADANQEVNKEHSKNIQKFPKVSSYDWFLSFMYPNEIINKGIRPLSYRVTEMTNSRFLGYPEILNVVDFEVDFKYASKKFYVVFFILGNF